MSAAEIIYLDNNATTQLDPAVLEEMLPFLTGSYGNPSSAYQLGARSRAAVERAREQVAALAGCEPSEIVFTSGGTESNNTAIHSALQLDPARQHIVTTAVEHSATLRFCEELRNRGGAVTFVGVGEDGMLDLDELEQAIRPETAIVTVQWANNETGVIFPIEEIAALARRQRGLFHTDAVQAAGKLQLHLRDFPISFCSLSAHKLHGPKGVGALFVDRRAAFRPLVIGGGQENSRRGGTENVPAIVGFGKAAELAARNLSANTEHMRTLRDHFENAVLSTVANVQVNGTGESRLPNTSSLAFAGIDSEAALLLLDRHGICCSAGSACRSGSPEPSHVLRAMNLSEERQRGTLRFSFGRFNTGAEVERASGSVTEIIGKLRTLGPVF